MSWSNTANAASYPANLGCAVSTANTNVTPGSTVTVTGSGFGANQVVTLRANGSDAGTAVASGSGSFTAGVVAPAGSSSLSIEATSSTKDCSTGVTTGGRGIDAVSTSRAATNPTHAVAARGIEAKSIQAKSSGLASTGFATVTASVIGFALLTGGLVFVVIGRRRSA